MKEMTSIKKQQQQEMNPATTNTAQYCYIAIGFRVSGFFVIKGACSEIFEKLIFLTLTDMVTFHGEKNVNNASHLQAI